MGVAGRGTGNQVAKPEYARDNERAGDQGYADHAKRLARPDRDSGRRSSVLWRRADLVPAFTTEPVSGGQLSTALVAFHDKTKFRPLPRPLQNFSFLRNSGSASFGSLAARLLPRRSAGSAPGDIDRLRTQDPLNHGGLFDHRDQAHKRPPHCGHANNVENEAAA